MDVIVFLLPKLNMPVLKDICVNFIPIMAGLPQIVPLFRAFPDVLDKLSMEYIHVSKVKTF